MAKASTFLWIYFVLFTGVFLSFSAAAGEDIADSRRPIVNTSVSPAAESRAKPGPVVVSPLSADADGMNSSFDASSGYDYQKSSMLLTPPNDNCADITPQSLPMIASGDNTGATNDCDLFLKGTQVWEAFTIDDKMDVTVSYCGTSPAFEVVYNVLVTGCPCEDQIIAHASDWEVCGDGNITIYFYGLDPGTYFVPVLASHPDFGEYYFTGPYTLNVTAEPWQDRYCDANSITCDEYISRVNFVEIDNHTECTGYGDYRYLSTLVDYGQAYPITVEVADGYNGDYGAVWIDWNQDQDFSDAGENIFLDVSVGPGPYTGTVIVPATARSGETRLRVRLDYGGPPDPCGASSYGEVEDYTVYVGGQPSYLTISHDAIDLGWVLPGDSAKERFVLGATGQNSVYFNIDFVYETQASVGGGVVDSGLRSSPITGEGYAPSASKGSTSLFTENFEGGIIPPEGWTIVVNNDYTWETGMADPYEGGYYALCRFDEYLTGMQNEWLISPAIDLGGKDYQLTFWWNGSYFHSVFRNTCTLAVWISLDGGATFAEKLWDNHQYGEFEDWQWNHTLISLSPYADEGNVKLAFVYTGEDGADFAIDAVSINLKPSPWLRADPWIGQVPSYRQTPVVLTGISKKLEIGFYDAEMIIVHTGATTGKSESRLPVNLLVGVASGVTIDPDPVNVLDAHRPIPPTGHAFIQPGLLPGGYTPEDVNSSTVRINGAVVPTSSAFVGEVLVFDFDLDDFVFTYPALWDTTSQPFDISGQFNDATPFTLNYDVGFIGYVPGDANLDGSVNVADAVLVSSYVFHVQPIPKVLETADANCDGEVNVSDAAYLIQYVFHEGSPPCHTR